MLHELQIKQTITNDPQVNKVTALFHTSSAEEISDLIQPVIVPLLQCIAEHYDKLKSEQFQQTIQHVIKTYQSISSDHILGHEVTQQIKTSTHNLHWYLKDNQPNITQRNSNKNHNKKQENECIPTPLTHNSNDDEDKEPSTDNSDYNKNEPTPQVKTKT